MRGLEAYERYGIKTVYGVISRDENYYSFSKENYLAVIEPLIADASSLVKRLHSIKPFSFEKIKQLIGLYNEEKK